jgi:hypothetical protein
MMVAFDAEGSAEETEAIASQCQTRNFNDSFQQPSYLFVTCQVNYIPTPKTGGSTMDRTLAGVECF